MKLDFPEGLQREFPQEFDLAWNAALDIVQCSQGGDFTALERHSPGLKGFDWGNYLRLSTIRMVRALRLMRQHCVPGARVLDFGAYFGNFSLMLGRAGYRTVAMDSYEQYGDCFRQHLELLRGNGIEVSNFPSAERQEAEGRFDAVLMMGVIEHIPHTPRLILEQVWRMLAPGGLLILDTPNLAYVYNRQRLARGESVFAPIESQYRTVIPFEGHQREYTAREIEWMLREARFEVQSFEAFNYSLYGLTELAGLDLANFEMMCADPSMRELLIYAAVRRSS